MKIKCSYPFDGFYYLSFYKREGRYRALIRLSNGKRIDMNYSRYLMCVKEKRILKTNEQVHHKDENKLNDDIDNLEILSDVEHGKIHHCEKQYIELICDNCNKPFRRDMKNYNSQLKRNERSFCCRSCHISFQNKMKPSRKRIKLPIKFSLELL